MSWTLSIDLALQIHCTFELPDRRPNGVMMISLIRTRKTNIEDVVEFRTLPCLITPNRCRSSVVADKAASSLFIYFVELCIEMRSYIQPAAVTESAARCGARISYAPTTAATWGKTSKWLRQSCLSSLSHHLLPPFTQIVDTQFTPPRLAIPTNWPATCSDLYYTVHLYLLVCTVCFQSCQTAYTIIRPAVSHLAQ